MAVGVKRRMLMVGLLVFVAASSVSGEEVEKSWFDRIEFAFGITGVLQGSTGAEERLSAEEDVTDSSMSFDMELTAPVVRGGKVYALFEAGGGNGIDGDIASFCGFNDDADDDASLRPTELWYEHNWFGERLRFRLGKVDLTTDFDVSEVANSETEQFLSSGFVNNLAVEFPDDNGFGAMLWIMPHDLFDVGIGVADAEADWDNVFDGVFSILELNFKPRFGERQGNYRIYGWFNGKDHVALKEPSKTKEDNYGFGLSFDQELSEVVTLFVRYGRQRGSVSELERAWSAGFQFHGKPWGREDDVLGLAYGVAVLGDDWEDVAQASGVDTGDEHHVEVYYNFKVNENLNISPDIQWARSANGDRDNGEVWVFGVRAQLSF